VRRLRPDSDKFRVPNIGWCRARFLPASIWARTSGAADTFYFSHSYYFDCARPEDITAVIEYSNRKIPVAIRCGNVVGVQFHPEKSQDAGMNLLAGIIRGLS
jgi:glutamine amidotransferase